MNTTTVGTPVGTPLGAIASPEAAASKAKETTLLSPRFYTTDFAAMDRINVEPIRAEWDAMMAEYEGDNNHDHFQRTPEFADEVAQRFSQVSPELRQEFMEFLITSVTSEFSGCVLYNEIQKNVTNPDVKALMRFMARDESRHAGFINQSLRDFGLGLDLGDLKRTKAYTYFKPKYIFYATYLSEKIGYARYITIFRQLERNPDKRFNLLWIRFFLLAVYATMYVRDHTRPMLHEAMGLHSTEYDYEVFRICSEISQQVFPLSLDIDHPGFRAGMDRLFHVQQRIDAAKAQGGLVGKLKQGLWAVAGAATFARLYVLPVKRHALPAQVRVAPVW
jgi:magnesium-protoporphyrin IX monomethyl ester (oxidative) cyclase